MVQHWIYAAGDDRDVVVSTRVSLVRNLTGLPFPASMEGICTLPDSSAFRVVSVRVGLMGSIGFSVELDSGVELESGATELDSGVVLDSGALDAGA